MGRRCRSVIWVLAMTVLVLALPLSGCTSGSTTDTDQRSVDEPAQMSTTGGEDVATIYLAGGCFWGVEKLMSSINGVIDAESGYAQGHTESPYYQDVVTGETGHAETVKVEYDPSVAPLPFILEIYYQAIDPTSVNRQGNDVGSQYRAGIYYSDPTDAGIVERSLAELQEHYDEPITVEAEPLTSFTTAEGFHQDYLEKNPGGYCHIDIKLFEEAAAAVPDPSHFTEAE